MWLEYVEKSGKFYIWHWCTNAGDGGVHPRWVKMGTGNHVVYVGPEGSSLTPSVHFNECCGLHGWITLGQWQNVPVQEVVIQNG